MFPQLYYLAAGFRPRLKAPVGMSPVCAVSGVVAAKRRSLKIYFVLTPYADLPH
jgi:hypothetical protein